MEIIEWFRQQSLAKSRYGHPTKKAIDLVLKTGGSVLRTNKQGSIAIAFEGELRYRAGGKLST
jgi:beta-lactamase superfamily II metal-dependent hydrolase